MENDKLIEALLSLSVETGSLACLGCGHEHNCGIQGCAIIREVAERYTDLQKRYDKLNDFEQSQCAKLLVQLASKDKQLAAAVEALESVAHSGGNLCEVCGADCIDAGFDDPETFQCGCFKWRGAQEAGEVEHD